MKRSDRLHDEELQIIDSLNKMTRQIHFSDQEKSSSLDPALLVESIEDIFQKIEDTRRTKQIVLVSGDHQKVH